MKKIGLICTAKKLSFLFILSVFLLFPKSLFAEEVIQESSPTSQIKVDHVANVMDRLKEKITLFFKFSITDKILYQQQLVEKRLAELKYVINDGQGDMIEEVSSRYAAYVGKFSEEVISKGTAADREKILTMYSSHSVMLETLRDHFPANSGFWLLLQHDINTIQIYTEKIKSSK